jgi:hypothetical protein
VEWRNILLNPSIPVVLGAAVTITGPEETLIRSYVMLLLAGWLWADIWIALVPATHLHLWRNVLLASLSQIIAIVLLVVVFYFFWSRQREEQDDVRLHLGATVTIPASNDAYQSTFTVRNGGATGIGDRAIYCVPVLFVGADGGSFLAHGLSESFPVSDAELKPNKSESDTCLGMIQTARPICLDIKLVMQYVLATQPSIHKEQTWRFVALPSAGIYQWHEQPADEPYSYCASYLSEASKQFYRGNRMKP